MFRIILMELTMMCFFAGTQVGIVQCIHIRIANNGVRVTISN